MKRITKPRTLVPLLVLLLIVSCEKYLDTKLPNIVLIIGDDHGYPYFGFMGADYVKTPNMDALASSGAMFKNGYVPDNHCRPSLATLVTGMLPIDYNNDVKQLILKEGIVDANLKREFSHNAMRHFSTLPKILKKKGYKSFQGGKWWEFHYENGGFDEGMTIGWTKEERKSEGWFRKFMGGYGLELARATMEPVYDFIDKNLESPFFLWYAPELPHYPFDAPEEYYDIYKDKDMTESAKRYYANCTWFDDGVGELIYYLKKVGEYENTLFIYVNDNGWEQTPDQEFWNDPMRSHNGGDKGKLSLFDQSFRTPIIFSWDGMIKRDVQLNHLIHSSDIPATILDYLGIEIPRNFHGKSYKNAIDGNDFSGREEILGNITTTRSFDDMMGKPTEGYWIRNEDWFFNWNTTEEEINLFDMKTDQNNDNNLSDQKPEIVKTMIEKIKIWKDERKREF
tara:strand:+ start:522 stop:1877 length:1356 start_codon:yes stop_codon:yes gene_type:complete